MALVQAADEAETRGWRMSQEETEAKIAELEAGGMAIMQPSDALAARHQEIGEVMTAEWEAQAGETGRAVVEAYRNR